MNDALNAALAGIRARAGASDLTGDWPAADLDALAAAGAWRWAVPGELGGDNLPALELHLLYERIAAASLATGLVLSQRDSALGLIEGADDSPARTMLLAGAAAGRVFLTIGIAQLTTSRQGGPPALRAVATGGGYRLDGYIPWSTGADRAAYIVAGAAVQGGGQVLFALPTDLPGVSVRPPAPLVSLAASRTAQVDLDGVVLERRWVLRGPVEKALGRRARAVPLPQAFLATGLCRGGLDLIEGHDSDRATGAHDAFARQLAAVREELVALCRPGREADAAVAGPRLRGTCNDLALRITHTAVALYKGAALLADHPAQRLAREALFLLVWSCPNAVIDCTLDLLTEE